MLGSDLIFQQFDRLAAGSTVRNLNIGLVKGVEIPIPTAAEQRRIVGILDEAFEGIATAKANAERNLQNARALFESHLQSVFTQPGRRWEETTIEECIKFIDYRGKTPEKTASGLRLITAKNVKMGFLQEEPMEFVAPETYGPWMTRGIPRKGDVLFTTEAPLGTSPNWTPGTTRWREAGYSVTLFFLSLPTPEAAIIRVAQRVRQGGHHVDDDVVRRRFFAGRENFEMLYKPRVDEWFHYDNAGAQPVLLAKGKNS